MNCRHCGTELPPGALFCGECGRSVTAAEVAPPRSSGVPFDTTTRSLRRAAASSPAPFTIESLGAEPPPLPSQPEIFFDREMPRSPAPRERDDSGDQPAVETPDEVVSPPDADAPSVILEAAEAEEAPGTETQSDRPAEPTPVVAPTPPPTFAPHPVADPSSTPPASPPATHVPPTVLPVPSLGRADPPPAEPFQDLESTRLVAPVGTGVRFVLQFSTGESVTIRGSGLIGRNPSAEPGEFVDQLVTLFDAGKSVSKTHLEFGQEGGSFWVSDRFSTNGSAIRPPGEAPRRCDPGKRYLVSRGTRVDVGEQFFVVS